MKHERQTLALLLREAISAAGQAVLNGEAPFTAEEIESAVQEAHLEAQKEWACVALTTKPMTNQNPDRSLRMHAYVSNSKTPTQDLYDKFRARSALGAFISTPKKPIAVEKPIGAGAFLDTYSMEHRVAVSRSKLIVVDVRSTALTPHAKPVAMGAYGAIGTVSNWASYKRLHAELERAMLIAADRVLSPWGIPAVADAVSINIWEKR